MNVKKIVGVILMIVAILIFLLLTNSIIYLYTKPEFKEWISSSGIGFLMLYVLTFFLFRLGRKWYRNKEEEIRGDILDSYRNISSRRRFIHWIFPVQLLRRF